MKVHMNSSHLIFPVICLSNKEKEPVPELLSCGVTPQSHIYLPPCALRRVKVKVAQQCPTSLQAHGILQARILEWVAFPFSRASSQPRDRSQVSHIAGRFFTS